MEAIQVVATAPRHTSTATTAASAAGRICVRAPLYHTHNLQPSAGVVLPACNDSNKTARYQGGL
jgi:hypothetical protein